MFKNYFNYKNIFINFPGILISLLPVFLITGPFLPDLAISVITILFLINTFKKKLFQYYKNLFFLVFILFYVYLVLNSLINNFNLDSIKISIFYFRYGIFSLAFWYILKKNKNVLQYLFYCFACCFIFLIIDGYYQYFTSFNLFGVKIDVGTYRPSSLFGDELILGSYLSRLYGIFFALFIYLYNYIYDKNRFYILGVIFVLVETLIFLSGERASFFYINLSSIFIIILIKDYKVFRIMIMVSAFILISFITLINDNAKLRIIDQTITQMNLDSNLQIKAFSRHHEDHYVSALRMFKDNKLLGVGVKNFRNFCDLDKYKINETSCATHPHNTYIQILTEIGIIGFLFIFSLLIFFVSNVIKHLFMSFKYKKRYHFNGFEVCLLSAIAITLWPVVPTGNFFNNWLNIIYYLPVGLLLFSLDKRKKIIYF
jgi:O-antigen ligase